MLKVLKIASYVLVPLACGLLADVVFEWLRRRRGARRGGAGGAPE